MDYNKTLNLPKTDFPMRAGLPQREPTFLDEWKHQDVYATLLKKNKGKPAFTLHDGPPFSNNNIHLGTAMNKILKDFINRHKAMNGYNMEYRPGWDNHGMPIESAIIKQNKLNRKKMSIPEFRNACQEFAAHFVDVQMEQFVRLGVIGDWDNPYLTMAPEFEAEEVRIFGKMFEKGYIYKGLKPIYWCPHDETALAEAEIEYQEDPCASIFVKFQVKDDKGLLSKHGDLSKMYFLIWTTTPWTLPGNLAIALHPQEQYVLAKAGEEYYITSEALLSATMAEGGIEEYEVVASMKGSDMEYMTACHPFLDRESLITNADYVTMDSGTGCVHTAPGFGADDYMTGKKYNLDLLVSVDDQGNQTEDAGMFAGMKYDESDKAIIKHLEEIRMLFALKNITHSYPHCWRCKQPIVFRAMPQWFCSVDAFKEESVAACRNVQWLPKWGEDRIISMIEDRADWCISRQRHWGLPIPVYYCKDCEKPVCNSDSINAVADIFEKEGSNAWYIKTAEELLPEGFKCPHCGGTHFEKETDTLDCWFDSGSTHIAALEKKDPGQWPSDMYLEGADQYRGWFQSSLLVAVATKNQGAPYKSVLTHGWVVDGKGKAMHKSAGNSVLPEKIIDKYGADLLRLWVASADYRVDVRASDEIFAQLSQTYLKIRNTCRYILGNLDGFDPNSLVSAGDMLPIDRWAVTRLNALIERCLAAYDRYEYHIVTHAMNNFCVVDMSNFYLDVIKDRLYCEGTNSPLRRSAQTAMFLVLDSMTRLLAPILAFTSYEVWNAMPHRSGDDSENVLFNDMPSLYADYALQKEDMDNWARLIAIREDINLALEKARGDKIIGKPLEAHVTLGGECSDFDFFRSQTDIIKTVSIISGLEFGDVPEGISGENYPDMKISVKHAAGEMCERCWRFDETVGANHVHATLCQRCAEVVSE